jgi:hypothetical protein
MKKYLGIRIAGLIILIAIVSFVAYKVYESFHGLTTGLFKMVMTNDIPNEYMNLFKNDTNITYKETRFDDNKNRNPVSDFVYDTKYAVIVTKIKTIGSLNSLPLITPQFHQTETTDDIFYNVIESEYSKFDYFLDTLSATNISLTLYGDSIRSLIKNDTVAGYYFMNKVFSISYKKNRVVNLFMKTTESEYALPTLLLFLVHQKSLYFICISVRDPKDKFNMNVINKLIDIPTPSRGRLAG